MMLRSGQCIKKCTDHLVEQCYHQRVEVTWDHFNWCWDSVIKTSTWKYDFKKKCLWPGWHWWQPSWLLYGKWIYQKKIRQAVIIIQIIVKICLKLNQTCNYFILCFVDKQICYFITDRTHFVFSEQVREVSGTFHKICFLKHMQFAGGIRCGPVL